MTFKDTYRLEKIYYENVYTLLNVLKSMKHKEVDLGTVKELLDNAIADNESIIIIYKNLGELYSEMQINLTAIGKQLKEIRDNIDSWKDEINDKIDYLNNSLMIYIREIWQRLDAIEADLAQMGRLFTYELTRENDEYILTESGNDVTFESTANLFSHNRAHLVTVRGNIDGEQTYFFPREYDLDSESGLFEWYSFGFVGNEIHEITVTLLPDNSVNVSIEKTDFELILLRLNAIETSLAEVIQRVTNAEEDIDTLEDIAENLQENKQDKLVAGSGISIDPDTNEISAQAPVYTGGDTIKIDNSVINAEEVGVFEDFSSYVIPSKEIAFALNQTYQDARFVYSGVLTTEITYANMIAMLEKYNGVRFSLGNISGYMPDSVHITVKEINRIIWLRDMNNSDEFILSRETPNNDILYHKPNSGSAINLVGGSITYLQGFKKLKSKLTANHRYNFYAEISAKVFIDGHLADRTELVALLANPSLSGRFSGIGLA